MIDKLFELLCGLGEPSAPALEPSDIKDANFQQLLSLTMPSAPHIVRDSVLNKEANARLKTVLSNKSHSPNNTIRTVKTMFEQAIQACDRDKERCMLQWLQVCVTTAVDMAFDEGSSESNTKPAKRATNKQQDGSKRQDNDDDDFVVPERYDRIGESDDDYVPSDEDEAIVPAAPQRKNNGGGKGKNGRKAPAFSMEIDEGAGSKAVIKYFTQNGTSAALKNGYFAQSYFFPSKESYNAFISVLNSATTSIDVCVFSLTDDDTADALIAAKKRNCKVRIITDDQQNANKYADATRLQADHGIPFKTDHSPSYMHNKFAIIDSATLINGSFNWSKGARTKNRENIVITNIPECIQAFQKEFDALWAEF